MNKKNPGQPKFPPAFLGWLKNIPQPLYYIIADNDGEPVPGNNIMDRRAKTLYIHKTGTLERVHFDIPYESCEEYYAAFIQNAVAHFANWAGAASPELCIGAGLLFCEWLELSAAANLDSACNHTLHWRELSRAQKRKLLHFLLELEDDGPNVSVDIQMDHLSDEQIRRMLTVISMV